MYYLTSTENSKLSHIIYNKEQSYIWLEQKITGVLVNSSKFITYNTLYRLYKKYNKSDL